MYNPARIPGGEERLVTRRVQYRETRLRCKRHPEATLSVARVWRAEGSVVAGAEDAVSGSVVTPGDLGLAEPDVVVAHIADPERERLRVQSADLGGRSTLLHFTDTGDSSIEITKAHPGDLPQFITGRSTLLSNLFRDEVARRNARLAAERITAKNTELRTTRGLEPVHLAVGLANWRIGAWSAPLRCCCDRSPSVATTPTSSSSCTARSSSTPSSSGRCSRTSASSSTAPVSPPSRTRAASSSRSR
nr:hypothetical protein GCM10025699_35400 [Microbacterium flavescens]